MSSEEPLEIDDSKSQSDTSSDYPGSGLEPWAVRHNQETWLVPGGMYQNAHPPSRAAEAERLPELKPTDKENTD